MAPEAGANMPDTPPINSTGVLAVNELYEEVLVVDEPVTVAKVCVDVVPVVLVAVAAPEVELLVAATVVEDA